MSCKVYCLTGVTSLYYCSTDGQQSGTIHTGGSAYLSDDKWFEFSVNGLASGYSGYYISADVRGSGTTIPLSSFPSKLSGYVALKVGGVASGGGGGSSDPTYTLKFYIGTGVKRVYYTYYSSASPYSSSFVEGDSRNWTFTEFDGSTQRYVRLWVESSDIKDGYTTPVTGTGLYFWNANRTVYISATKQTATYGIRFDTNTGDTVTNMPSDISGVYGNVQLPSNAPRRDGYRFDYWYDRNNTHYAPNGIINVTQNITLYAHWTQTTYYLYFNANTSDHVSSIPTTISRVGTGNVTIPSNVPLRDFYRFTEWNTNSSGTGLAYQPSATFSLTSNATLYAQWQRIWTHTITYDANGGILSTYGSTTTKSFDYNGTTSSFYITIKTRSELGALRTGYTFTGWNDVAGGTGSSFIGGNSYSFSGDYTLYAQWTPDSYTITLDPNGGDIGGSSRPRDFTQNYGTTFTFQSSYEPTRAGYNFLGWSYNGLTKQTGDTWFVNGTATWTAIWSEPLLFHITFDGNGGTTAMGNYQYITHGYYGDTIDLQTITSNFNERDGLQLYGWDSDSSKSWNGDLEFYTVGDLTIRGDRTVYAIWAPAYTVSYYSQGRLFATDFGDFVATIDNPGRGSGYLPNAYADVIDLIPTWGNHDFKGWANSSSATVPDYTSGQAHAIPVSGNVTLYAVWQWQPLEPFYWTGSYSGDLALFQTGLPVSDAITAAGWNNLIVKIDALIQRAGLSVSTAKPSYATSGMSITASLYNAMRGYIIAVLLQMNIGTAYFPPTVSTGDAITPYHFAFEGTNSLQGAVNHAISVFNNSLN